MSLKYIIELYMIKNTQKCAELFVRYENVHGAAALR